MPSTASRIHLWTLDEIGALPDPEWLIDGILPVGGFTLLHGAEGTGKSFVALDWAMSIASGRSWFGREAKAGLVIYVSAEGFGGLKKRIPAWRDHHGVANGSNIRFVEKALQILEGLDVDDLIKEVRAAAGGTPIRLIVIDTLARCFGGGDENTAKDMNNFVAGVGKLQSEMNAAVLVVHHDDKQGRGARGSSALTGAADVMISLTIKGQRTSGQSAVITLRNHKMKDDEEFKPIAMQLRTVSAGKRKDGRPLTSCVLGLTDGARDVVAADRSREDATARRVLDFVSKGPTTRGELLRFMPGVSPKTVDRRISDLESEGRILKSGNGRARKLSLVCPPANVNPESRDDPSSENAQHNESGAVPEATSNMDTPVTPIRGVTDDVGCPRSARGQT